MTDRPLRPHQATAIERLKLSLRQGKRRPVLQASTGFGKTRVAGEIITSALAKGKRVAFVVPAVSLVDQTVESFYRDGITSMGVIQADHIMTDWSKPVQICSIQSVERRGFPDADLVLVDECHKVFKAQVEWIKARQDIPFIGMSATPWTKGLGKIYDDLIIASTTQGLIDGGYLSPFRVFAPGHPDLSKVKTVAGEYHEGQLAEVMSDGALVADTVETWIKLGEGRPTLVFAVDRAHAKTLQNKFEACGIPAGYVDAYTSPDERKSVRDKFKRGEYPVVCSVGTLTTGVDWDVRCIVLARPTKSEMLFTQIIGRGLRTAQGKEDCLILDHSDNHTRLGFVTDIHYEKLNMGKKQESEGERKPPLPKECPSCQYLRPAKVSKCPNCGFVPEMKSDLETVDGDLTEITRGKSKKGLVPAGHIRVGKAVFPERQVYGMLNNRAIERGYKSGWASAQFKELAGKWPPFSWRDMGLSNEPAPELLSWLRSRQIAYSKARAKQTQGAPDATIPA